MRSNPSSESSSILSRSISDPSPPLPLNPSGPTANAIRRRNKLSEQQPSSLSSSNYHNYAKTLPSDMSLFLTKPSLIKEKMNHGDQNIFISPSNPDSSSSSSSNNDNNNNDNNSHPEIYPTPPSSFLSTMASSAIASLSSNHQLQMAGNFIASVTAGLAANAHANYNNNNINNNSNNNNTINLNTSLNNNNNHPSIVSTPINKIKKSSNSNNNNSSNHGSIISNIFSSSRSKLNEEQPGDEGSDDNNNNNNNNNEDNEGITEILNKKLSYRFIPTPDNPYPVLSTLECYTHISSFGWVLFTIIGLILIIFCGIGTSIFSTFLGILYPIYASWEALAPIDQRNDLIEEWKNNKVLLLTTNNNNNNNHDPLPPPPLTIDELSSQLLALRHCLVYWLISSLFWTFELLFDRLLSWFPLYYPFKFLFLLWCFLPYYKGAHILFDSWLAPLVVKHTKFIDKGVEATRKLTDETVTVLGKEVRKNSAMLSEYIVMKGKELVRQASLSLSSNYNNNNNSNNNNNNMISPSPRNSSNNIIVPSPRNNNNLSVNDSNNNNNNPINISPSPRNNNIKTSFSALDSNNENGRVM